MPTLVSLVPASSVIDGSTATESQARSAARLAGFVLRKSRAPISPENRGGLMILDESTMFPSYGFWFELEPQDVIDWLKD